MHSLLPRHVNHTVFYGYCLMCFPPLRLLLSELEMMLNHTLRLSVVHEGDFVASLSAIGVLNESSFECLHIWALCGLHELGQRVLIFLVTVASFLILDYGELAIIFSILSLQIRWPLTAFSLPLSQSLLSHLLHLCACSLIKTMIPSMLRLSRLIVSDSWIVDMIFPTLLLVLVSQSLLYFLD